MIVICLFFFIKPFQLSAQTGSIEGIVRDKATNETLMGASVSIEGSVTGVITNAEGQFRIANLKPGTYRIKVTFVAYNSFVSDDVAVIANNAAILNVFLVSSSVNLSTVKVSAS
ncbi:MAG TPA: carboxypeptidase-like regulatory domain-containing protein [Bacteroidales bacterium]